MAGLLPVDTEPHPSGRESGRGARPGPAADHSALGARTVAVMVAASPGLRAGDGEVLADLDDLVLACRCVDVRLVDAIRVGLQTDDLHDGVLGMDQYGGSSRGGCVLRGGGSRGGV